MSLDGGQAQSIPVNGTVTFSDVDVGSHSVQISGLANNCDSSGANPQTVTVAGGATANVNFSVFCPGGSISGVITVTNALLSVKPTAATPRLSISSPRRSSEPEYEPDALVVIFYPGPVAAPGRRLRLSTASSTVRRVAQAMTTALAPQQKNLGLEVGPVLPHLLAARVRVPQGVSLESAAQELRLNPAVREVRRSQILRLDKSFAAARAAPIRPNDRLYPFQARHYSMVDLPRAWNIRTTSPSVVVAVIDDGISAHPDIVPNVTTDGYDFVLDVPVPLCSGGTVSHSGDGDDFDPDPTQPVAYLTDPVLGCLTELNPVGNHGLQVASVIGAVGNDNQGIAGASWSVQIRPVRVFGVALG